MTTLSKTFLPDVIERKGKTYTRHEKDYESPITQQAEKLKKAGYSVVLVKVLQKNLRGREDFHGKLYQPSQWLFKAAKN